mmetsp:Transcript_10591/g.43788  ORF Transcript_10591/g.43788 Transcript_10591/m.43788 type:complete len:277 (+) Transcript_10591:913-1743(+)
MSPTPTAPPSPLLACGTKWAGSAPSNPAVCERTFAIVTRSFPASPNAAHVLATGEFVSTPARASARLAHAAHTASPTLLTWKSVEGRTSPPSTKSITPPDRSRINSPAPPSPFASKTAICTPSPSSCASRFCIMAAATRSAPSARSATLADHERPALAAKSERGLGAPSSITSDSRCLLGGLKQSIMLAGGDRGGFGEVRRSASRAEGAKSVIGDTRTPSVAQQPLKVNTVEAKGNNSVGKLTRDCLACERPFSLRSARSCFAQRMYSRLSSRCCS